MIVYQVKLKFNWNFPRCPHGMKFVILHDLRIPILEVQIESADPATAHHRRFGLQQLLAACEAMGGNNGQVWRQIPSWLGE